MSNETETTQEQPIGWLTTLPGERGYRIVGPCCAILPTSSSPVYRVNVNPYKAVCVYCAKVLHHTCTEVELYDGK